MADNSEQGEIYPKHRNYSASTILRANSLTRPALYKSLLVLTGDRGVGKSSVVAQWLKDFNKVDHRIKVIQLFVGCSAHSKDIAVFLDRSLQQLRKHFLTADTLGNTNDGNETWYNNGDQPTNFHETCEAFLAAGSLGPCVLVLDGIDEFGGSLSLTPQEVKEFSWLPQIFPPRCRIIVTTNKSDLSYHTLSKRSDSILVSVPPIHSETQRKQVLKSYLKEHYKHLTKECRSLMMDIRPSNRPLFLSTISAEVKCFGVYQKLAKYLENNNKVCSVRELWAKALQRWMVDYSWVLELEDPAEFDYCGWVCDALCLLALSRHGLSQMEMMQLLTNMGYVGELQVTQYDWLQFRSCLGPSVYDRADGLMDFSHQHLRDIVEFIILHVVKSSTSETCGESSIKNRWEEKKRQLHCQLVTFFQNQPKSQRRLQELPWQLMLAGQHKALFAFITNLDYIFDLLDVKGKFPGNKHDLETYWRYITKHTGQDIAAVYHEVLVQTGLLESVAIETQSIKVEEDPDSTSTMSKSPTEPDVEDEESSNFVQCTVQPVPLDKEPEPAPVKLIDSDRQLTTSLGWFLAQFLLGLGYVECAEEIFVTLIRCLTAHYPLTSYEFLMMAESYETLGNIYISLEDFRQSEGCYRHALEIIKDLLDDNNGDLDMKKLVVLKSRLLEHHGNILLNAGELDEAEKLFKTSLESIQDFAGYATLRATIFYHLGLLRFQQGDWIRSESCLKQALCIREQWFGKSHPLVADVLVAQARLLSTQRNILRFNKVQAEFVYSRAIEIRELCLPPNDLSTAELLYELGCLIGDQSSQGAKMESIRLLRKAIDTRTIRLGARHPETKVAQKHLTSQEVMLTLGHYEHGHARPVDTRTSSRPQSNLTFRETDLYRMKQQQTASAKQKLRENQMSQSTPSRDDIMMHNQQHLSILGRSPGEGRRSKLLQKELMNHSRAAELSDDLASSLTSDSSIRKLTVDLSFAGGTGVDEDEETIGETGEEDNEGSTPKEKDNVVQRQKQTKTVSIRSTIDIRPLTAPVKLFAKYADGGGAYDDDEPNHEDRDSIGSRQSHRTTCSIPGRHTINLSNVRSIDGPHSSILSLLGRPGRELTPFDHHKAAWYHVDGRYSRDNSPRPPRKFLCRPGSVVPFISPLSIYDRPRKIPRSERAQRPKTEQSLTLTQYQNSNRPKLKVEYKPEFNKYDKPKPLEIGGFMLSFRPETVYA